MTDTDSPLERLAAAVASRYRILREIGSGGMATVYLAEDLKHQRQVAVKVLRPELAASLGPERFLREIRIAARLQHPHIVPLYDSGEASGLLYYVMPYIEGETLRDRLKRDSQLSVGETVRLTREIGLGLAFAHAQGVIHRDVKPENVMLTGETAVVTDFGIAWAVAVAGGDRLTQTGLAIGTPAYMSPEQAGGAIDVDARSDVYSLGCVAYEMLVGQPPFSGPTALAVLARHSLDPVPSIQTVRRTIPPGMQQSIEKALAKVPADRFATVQDFVDSLERAAGTGGAMAAPPAAPGGTRWVRWALGAGAAVVLLAAGLVARHFVRPSATAAKTPMIVVLPFENVGPPSEQYFADGLTDEITRRLAGFAGLGTISWTSAMEYAGRRVSIREVSKELGVDYVLTGTARTDRAADGSGLVRVVPRLIRVAAEQEIWTDRLDANLVPGEIFAIQERIAELVASALDVSLLLSEREALRTRPTANQAAYEAYLRGAAHAVQKFAEEPTRLAAESFAQAVALDPTFALAHARLAEVLSMSDFFFGRSKSRLAQAEAAARRALALQPTLPEARIAMGYYYYWGRLDYDQAMEQFGQVLTGQPNNSELLWIVGSLERRRGEWDRALTLFHRAERLDPRSATYAFELGVTYQVLRRYAEAEPYLARASALTPTWIPPYVARSHLQVMRAGDSAAGRRVLEDALRTVDTTALLADIVPFYRWHLAFVGRPLQSALERTDLAASSADSAATYLARAELHRWSNQAGLAATMYDSARMVFEDRVRTRPDDPKAHSHLGIAYAGLGRSADGIREAELAVALRPLDKDAFGSYLWTLELAQVLTLAGRYPEAIEELRKVLLIPSSVSVEFLKLHPAFAPLRDLPAFRTLLASAGPG